MIEPDLVTIFEPAIDGPKTVVVLGSNRGGTSFVAQTLHEIVGVPMGLYNEYGLPYVPGDLNRIIDYSNYEDYIMANAIRAKSKLVQAIIDVRNAANDTWGFKWPGTVFHLNRILPLLRNPHLVVITRDPLACWQGDKCRANKISIVAAAHHFYRLVSFIDDPPAPLAAASFERARNQQAAFAIEVGRFLGLNQLEVKHAEPESTSDSQLRS